MQFRGLREFIGILETENQLVRIEAQVDPKHELSAIASRLSREKNLAVLFENVKGSEIPVLTNLLLSRKRISIALKAEENQLSEEWIRRMDATWPTPRIVSHSPCKDVILKVPEEFDLTRNLPQVWWNPGDGGPFILGAVVITKNPETKVRNMGVYAMQIHGKDKLGLRISPLGDTGVNYQKAVEREEPLEIAVCIGVDPVILLAAAASLAYGEDELSLAGALKERPINLVKCETLDLEVPAYSEIVLEGRVPPAEQMLEGPFVEDPGYVETVKTPRPVIQVETVAYRETPIYQGIVCGIGQNLGINEDAQIGQISREALTLRAAGRILSGIKNIHMPVSGRAMYIGYVSIRKESPDMPERAMHAVWGTPTGRGIKYLVVVDDDINVRDKNQVEWAIATRSQPRSYLIIPVSKRYHYDPSKEFNGIYMGDPSPEIKNGINITSKIGIDATIPFDKKDVFQVSRFSEEITKRVEARWSELFESE